MKRLLTALLLLAAPAFGASGQWASDAPYNVDGSFVECTTLGIPARSPTQFWQVVETSNVTGVSAENQGALYVMGQWSAVDVSHWVPVGTKAIHLDGLLIITHTQLDGNKIEVTAAFRRHGETYDFIYIGQTVDVWNSGQRSNMGAWVALSSDLKFDVKWNVGGTGAGFAGISLRMTAYCR